LRNDFQLKQGSHLLHVSNKAYIKEVLCKYQEEHHTLPKKNIPMSPRAHPELDTSKLLDDTDTRQYQKIIGIGQWLVVAGRFDINYAISSLSQYAAAAPRKGHLAMAEDILGYFNKYPARGYIISPKPPKIDPQYDTVKLTEDFGGQYPYFLEDLDPKFQTPLVPEMAVNLFVDANHAQDKVTGRSVTGLFCFVRLTPVLWQSKQQASVQTSTFGAEFTALRKAVEGAITLRY
jgi:hypothetical protein